GLFMDLYDDLGMADVADLEFPIIYCQAKAGKASLEQPENGTSPAAENLDVLIDVLLKTIPAPSYDPAMPLQAHVTNLDASPYLGRLALCRIRNGTMTAGQQIAWCQPNGDIKRAKIAELLVTQGLERVAAQSAGPGDLIAVAGIADVMIGDTLADPDDPRLLPGITVDEPSISMTIGINTSPLAGRSGKKLTARLLRNRLDSELVGNVSIKVLPTERPDTWEVQGRGELALAVLVETFRREGFELTVGRPQVVTREVDGKIQEPFEHVTIDAPEEFVGALTQLLSVQKGRMETLANHGTGWTRMEWIVPSRGLIGFRTEFLTETRGTAVLNAISHGYGDWVGELRSRQNGSMVADRTGVATAYAMFALQERGSMLVEPGTEVYEGMVIGENSRQDEMDVNVCRERKLTNVRQSTGEELTRLVPPRMLSLEQALEFCAIDECLEVTPAAVRVRKVTLTANLRARERGKRAVGR
ncbi:MAG: EF-Tu/IF-2/RF-3 family GTPase, partial [Antricoccus sp.]